MEFDRFLADWFGDLPDGLRRELDYSVGSLSALEAELLSKFQSIEDIRQDTFLFYHNAAAIYLGETARKACGGKWTINFDDEDFVFFGVPILELKGANSPVCPMALITAVLDRRRGDYMEGLVRRWEGKANLSTASLALH